MSLAIFICMLFILLMQSVNGAQFLNITFLMLFPASTANAATVTVSLTSIYKSL